MLILSDSNFEKYFSRKKAVRFYPNINKKHPNVKASYFLLPYAYNHYENISSRTFDNIIKSLTDEIKKPTYKSIDYHNRFQNFPTQIGNRPNPVVHEAGLKTWPNEKNFVLSSPPWTFGGLGNKILISDEMKKDLGIDVFPKAEGLGKSEVIPFSILIKKIQDYKNIFLDTCKIYYKRIFEFKEGINPELSAAIFFESFGRDEFFKDKILIPISSSKKVTNIKRYKDFLNLLCAISGAVNGLDFFEIEEKNEKHKTLSNSKIIFKATNNEHKIKNKKVVLIDDMFTTGRTVGTWLDELNKWSPLQIECIFLSKALDRGKYFKKNEKARILIPSNSNKFEISHPIPFWTFEIGVTLKFDFFNRYNINDGDIVEILGPSEVKGFIDVIPKDEDGNYIKNYKNPYCAPFSIPDPFLVQIESVYDTGKVSESPPF